MELLDYLYEVNAELEALGRPFVKPADVDIVADQVIKFVRSKELSSK